MASLVAASGCLGFIQKSRPSQKLYACRTSDKDKTIAKTIQSKIFALVDSLVKSGNSNDSRKIVTTHAVVAT